MGSSITWGQEEDLSVMETSIEEEKIVSEQETSVSSGENRGWKRRNNIDPTDSEKAGRPIDLRSILEEGFRKNPFQKIREQKREQIELSKTDVWQKFWLPKISLELDTSNQKIDRFHQSSLSTPGMGAQQAPTGSLGLVIDEYTLFNWGRDYLQYQNNKQTLNRASQQLNE